MALDQAASSNVPERQRAQKIAQPYSLGQALGYVFRGQGLLMLPGYVLCMVLAATLPGFGAAIGWLVRLLLPGLVFEIVRSTSTGDDILPDWPDYSDLADRGREGLWMLLILLVSCLPAIAFVTIAGGDLEAFMLGELGAGAWLGLLAGAVLGAVIYVFALGSTSCHSSGWLSFRIDLHLRALFTGARADALKTAGLLAALFFCSQLVAAFWRPVPVLGAAVESTLSGYALFTGAHLVGLVFRRHGQELDLIYRD